jgi:hypothetical protein
MLVADISRMTRTVPPVDSDAHRRLPAAKATKAGHVIRGSTRGYVLGVDFSGPYPESNDGETYAIQGVEVGHTDFGLLHCCKDKSGVSADTGVADFIRTLETQGTKKVIRVHSDQDAAFVQGDLATLHVPKKHRLKKKY